MSLMLFSVLKIKNAVLVFSGFLISLFLKKPIAFGMPLTLSVEPVNFCNLSCPECPVGNGTLARKKAQMELETYRNIIQQSRQGLFYLTLYFQGEPLLHPEIIKMIQIAKKANLYVAISTNAQLLNDEMAKNIVESGVNKLIVSIDGTTQEVYEKYRQNGLLSLAINGIANIQKWKRAMHKKTPLLEMQFLVLKHNEHQLVAVKKLAKQLEVDKLSFKSAQICDYKHGSDLIPTKQKYARYKKNADGTYRRKKKMRNRCWRAFSGAVITVTGDVVPCSFDKNGTHVFGNIREHSLRVIWHSQKAQAFREQVLTDRKGIEICRNCIV